MKKLLFTLVLCLSFLSSVFAQEVAPVIQELRALLAEAGTGFQTSKGGLIEKDPATGTSYYKTTHPPEVSVSEHFLVEPDSEKPGFYIIRYNVKDMDAMTLRIMMVMTQKYVDELNAMVKSETYVGRDYKTDEGLNVTEIKDTAGRNIVDYRSDAENQMLIVYSTQSK